jgi:UDP-N-acetylglucosamine 2-epimerase
MPEEINRVVADHLATWCLAPTPAGVANLAAEGIIEGVRETGDLMQDLAARVVAEVRGFDALLQAGIALAAAGAPDLAGRLRPGGFVFVTIHRAENREPPALAAWSAILGDAARSGRLVILALQPGTRVALEGTRVVLPAGIRVVEPLGYRTSLTLQLHAAAVLTDSGGIQREAAWLGTPCLVLRSSTEWVEATAASAGQAAVIGLDRVRAASELARIAPAETSEVLSRARAEALDLQPAGAAQRIVEALEVRPVLASR